MKITRESDYGIRAVIHIATYQRKYKRRISLLELSSELRLPKSFLSKILQKLVSSGILGSKRGNSGGFYLNKDGKDITALDIISQLEGNIDIIECNANPKFCKLYATCVVNEMWKKVKNNFNSTIGKYTIAYFCRKKLKKGFKQ